MEKPRNKETYISWKFQNSRYVIRIDKLNINR